MKKLLAIVVLGLLLLGCSQNKTKKALENCADKAYGLKYKGKNADVLFKNNKEIQRQIKLMNMRSEEIKKIKSTIIKYSNENLVDSSFFTNYYFGELMKYSIGFYLDRRDIAIKPGDLNYRTNETKQKKYEILKFLLDEINKLILANEREQSLYTSIGYQKALIWNELNLNEKMQSKLYAQKHKNCEIDYNRTPKSFLAQWYK